MSGRFATALACIDGRAVPPIQEYMMSKYNAVYIDLITAPGIAQWLSDGADKSVRTATTISVQAHDSAAIAVCAHADCAASPVDEATGRNHILAAMDEVASWDLGRPIIGLWVDEGWRAKKVGELAA